MKFNRGAAESFGRLYFIVVMFRPGFPKAELTSGDEQIDGFFAEMEF
jgi:hypothetical protein